MEFAFSEDQLAFRDAVRDLLARTCPPEAVRAAWDADDPWDGDRWDALVEMGVVALTVPEADGGLGMTEVDLVLLLEEAGRAAQPEPLMESALLPPHVP
ncbi:MAG: acyl-CoA dehydrogenase family protein, partial [Acidimicrobiales bacterium]